MGLRAVLRRASRWLRFTFAELGSRSAARRAQRVPDHRNKLIGDRSEKLRKASREARRNASRKDRSRRKHAKMPNHRRPQDQALRGEISFSLGSKIEVRDRTGRWLVVTVLSLTSNASKIVVERNGKLGFVSHKRVRAVPAVAMPLRGGGKEKKRGKKKKTKKHLKPKSLALYKILPSLLNNIDNYGPVLACIAGSAAWESLQGKTLAQCAHTQKIKELMHGETDAVLSSVLRRYLTDHRRALLRLRSKAVNPALCDQRSQSRSDRRRTKKKNSTVPALAAARAAEAEHKKRLRRGIRYTGKVDSDGHPHGRGTAVYELRNGPNFTWLLSEYTGQWKNGKFHGEGTLRWKCGDVYVGGFKNDEICGKGKMTFANGDVYVGGYKNDEMCGKGKMTFASGSSWANAMHPDSDEKPESYEGMYRGDQMHGFGKYTFATSCPVLGKTHCGNWVFPDSYSSDENGEWV